MGENNGEKKVLFDSKYLISKLVEIAEQTKEFSTKRKLISDLLAQLGVFLDPQDTKSITPPIINIIVDKRVSQNKE